MTWAYTEAGKEMGCPSSETGLYVDGPLTVNDWQKLLGFIVEEIAEQAVREAEAKFSKLQAQANARHPDDVFDVRNRR